MRHASSTNDENCVLLVPLHLCLTNYGIIFSTIIANAHPHLQIESECFRIGSLRVCVQKATQCRNCRCYGTAKRIRNCQHCIALVEAPRFGSEIEQPAAGITHPSSCTYMKLFSVQLDFLLRNQVVAPCTEKQIWLRDDNLNIEKGKCNGE